MSNDQHSPALHGSVNCLLYEMLTLRIKSTCGLGGGRKSKRGLGGEGEGTQKKGAEQ